MKFSMKTFKFQAKLQSKINFSLALARKIKENIHLHGAKHSPPSSSSRVTLRVDFGHFWKICTFWRFLEKLNNDLKGIIRQHLITFSIVFRSFQINLQMSGGLSKVSGLDQTCWHINFSKKKIHENPLNFKPNHNPESIFRLR